MTVLADGEKCATKLLAPAIPSQAVYPKIIGNIEDTDLKINTLAMDKQTEVSEVRPVLDALDIIGGKWKFPILFSLFHGKKRFKELERDLCGITPKMLSKELKDLEMNGLVSREVFPTVPVTVEYTITDCGLSLEPVLRSIQAWGRQHRSTIIRKS